MNYFGYLLLVASMLLPAGAPEPGRASAETQILGRWVAVNRSKGGIGSIWEFHQDGTLRMSPAAVVEMPYQLKGNTLTLPPGTTLPNAKPQVLKVRIEGNSFYEGIEGSEKEIRLKRVQDGRPGDAPIVGEWKADETDVPADLSPGRRASVVDAIHIYTRDGIYKLRIPFKWRSGTFDLEKQTFTLNFTGQDGTNRQFTGHFSLSAGQLHLTQPDGVSTDVYVKDDFE